MDEHPLMPPFVHACLHRAVTARGYRCSLSGRRRAHHRCGLTTHTLSAVSIDEQPGEAARTFGAFAVIIGLLITAFGFLTDGVPVRGYYFAGLWYSSAPQYEPRRLSGIAIAQWRLINAPESAHPHLPRSARHTALRRLELADIRTLREQRVRPEPGAPA